jgi:WD40 repeat protein
MGLTYDMIVPELRGQACTVRLWSIPTLKAIRTIEAHSGVVSSVAFSLDGSRLLSGGSDGLLKLWNVTSGVLAWKILVHSDKIMGLPFLQTAGGYSRVEVMEQSESGTPPSWHLLKATRD